MFSNQVVPPMEYITPSKEVMSAYTSNNTQEPYIANYTLPMQSQKASEIITSNNEMIIPISDNTLKQFPSQTLDKKDIENKVEVVEEQKVQPHNEMILLKYLKTLIVIDNNINLHDNSKKLSVLLDDNMTFQQVLAVTIQDDYFMKIIQAINTPEITNLIMSAFTHEESNKTNNYERLEYQGDKILSVTFFQFLEDNGIIVTNKTGTYYNSKFLSNRASNNYLMSKIIISYGFDKYLIIPNNLSVNINDVTGDLLESLIGLTFNFYNMLYRSRSIGLDFSRHLTSLFYSNYIVQIKDPNTATKDAITRLKELLDLLGLKHQYVLSENPETGTKNVTLVIDNIGREYKAILDDYTRGLTADYDNQQVLEYSKLKLATDLYNNIISQDNYKIFEQRYKTIVENNNKNYNDLLDIVVKYNSIMSTINPTMTVNSFKYDKGVLELKFNNYPTNSSITINNNNYHALQGELKSRLSYMISELSQQQE